MQAGSRWTPNGNSVMSSRRPHIYALTAETSTDLTDNWMESASGQQPLYHYPRLRSAVSVDPIRILIVADSELSIQVATLVHSIGRFDTRTACAADPALSIARYFLPSIVLMSTDLPDFAGYHLAPVLRWQSGLASLRLIALTNDIPSTDRRRALAAGFEQYLTLPVQQAALESALIPGFASRPRGLDLRRVGRRPSLNIITDKTHELRGQAPDLP